MGRDADPALSQSDAANILLRAGTEATKGAQARQPSLSDHRLPGARGDRCQWGCTGSQQAQSWPQRRPVDGPWGLSKPAGTQWQQSQYDGFEVSDRSGKTSPCDKRYRADVHARVQPCHRHTPSLPHCHSRPNNETANAWQPESTLQDATVRQWSRQDT